MPRKPDFKGTPLFNVEYLKNDMRSTHGYYRQLTEVISGKMNFAIANDLI